MPRGICGTIGAEGRMRFAMAAFGLLLAGCLTHLPPPPSHCQLRVNWSHDFAQARARATAEDKPIYLVLAAGELDGPC